MIVERIAFVVSRMGRVFWFACCVWCVLERAEASNRQDRVAYDRFATEQAFSVSPQSVAEAASGWAGGWKRA